MHGPVVRMRTLQGRRYAYAVATGPVAHCRDRVRELHDWPRLLLDVWSNDGGTVYGGCVVLSVRGVVGVATEAGLI